MPDETPRERLQRFVDAWHPQFGDVIGRWDRTIYDDDEQPVVTFETPIVLLHSDLVALLDERNHPYGN